MESPQNLVGEISLKTSMRQTKRNTRGYC